MQTFRKALLAVLFGSCLACVGIFVFIHLYYYSSLPTAPDETAGRTFKMEVNHGFVRYGSGQEFRVFRAIEEAFPLSAFPFLVALALGVKWGIFRVRGANEA